MKDLFLMLSLCSCAIAIESDKPLNYSGWNGSIDQATASLPIIREEDLSMCPTVTPSMIINAYQATPQTLIIDRVEYEFTASPEKNFNYNIILYPNFNVFTQLPLDSIKISKVEAYLDENKKPYKCAYNISTDKYMSSFELTYVGPKAPPLRDLALQQAAQNINNGQNNSEGTLPEELQTLLNEEIKK